MEIELGGSPPKPGPHKSLSSQQPPPPQLPPKPDPSGHRDTRLQILFCLISLLSVLVSGFLGYHVMKLEDRVRVLEFELVQKLDSSAGQGVNVDMLVQRLRRDVSAQIQRTADARIKRDVEGCGCPPGKFFHLQEIAFWDECVANVWPGFTDAMALGMIRG